MPEEVITSYMYLGGQERAAIRRGAGEAEGGALILVSDSGAEVPLQD